MRAWLGLVATVIAGCRVSHTFVCTADPQCHLGTMIGTCQPTGFCSFPDPACPSGERYDPDSGDALGGTCVAPAPPPADAAIDAFPPFERRIHIAGATYVGSDFPGTWEGDPGHASCPSGTTYSVTGSINGTVDGPLFMTDLFSYTSLACTFPNLPAGRYRVALPLAEIFYGCSGPNQDRVVDVTLEGTPAGTIDFMTEGGGCAISPGTGHPFVMTYEVDVTDGTLDLQLASTTAAVIDAIEIVRIQ